MFKTTSLGIDYDATPSQYSIKTGTQKRLSVPARMPGGHMGRVTLTSSGLAYKVINGHYIPGRLDDGHFILRRPNDAGYLFARGTERTYCPSEFVAEAL